MGPERIELSKYGLKVRCSTGERRSQVTGDGCRTCTDVWIAPTGFADLHIRCSVKPSWLRVPESHRLKKLMRLLAALAALPAMFVKELAGHEGVEPSLLVLETNVQPLTLVTYGG